MCEFNFRQSRVYRLLEAAEVERNISTMVGYEAGRLDAMRAELDFWLPLLKPADAVGDWLQSQ